MTKFLKSMLLFIVWNLLVYISIAFLGGKYEASDWNWDSRYFMVFMGFWVGLFISAAYYFFPKI